MEWPLILGKISLLYIQTMSVHSLGLVRPSPGGRPSGKFNDWFESRYRIVIVDHIAVDGYVKTKFEGN